MGVIAGAPTNSNSLVPMGELTTEATCRLNSMCADELVLNVWQCVLWCGKHALFVLSSLTVFCDSMSATVLLMYVVI